MKFRVNVPIAGNSMQSKPQSGFTLIELMVTLLVLVILAVLAAPSFTAMIEKSRLRGAADDVVNLLSIARAEAVKRQRNVNVALGGSTSDWCVGANRAPDPAVGQPTPGATSCDCKTPSSCVLENQQSVVTPPANSGITSDTVTPNITFNAQTGALIPVTTPPGVVTLTSSSSKFALQITVSPLGQVAACVPSGKTFISGYPSC